MSGSVFKTMVKSYMYYQASQNHEQIKACEVCTLLNIKRIYKKLNYKIDLFPVFLRLLD